ncbi:hypothetical protein MTR67_008622, partial [Solanum verrucosum]
LVAHICAKGNVVRTLQKCQGVLVGFTKTVTGKVLQRFFGNLEEFYFPDLVEACLSIEILCLKEIEDTAPRRRNLSRSRRELLNSSSSKNCLWFKFITTQVSLPINYVKEWKLLKVKEK